MFPTSALFRAALASFTNIFADAYAADNIRINNILPGWIDRLPATEERSSHFCAGRWSAQRLIPHLLRPLLERLPDLKLVSERPPEFRGWEFRAPGTL